MKRPDVVEAACAICGGEEEPTLFGLCQACCLYEKVLPAWMVRLLFEEDSWIQPNAWREYLDAQLARVGSEDHVTAWTLAGPMSEHWWARKVLEAVS